jgi:hypothetical protein
MSAVAAKEAGIFFKVAHIFATSRVHLHLMLKVKTFFFFCVGYSSINYLVTLSITR